MADIPRCAVFLVLSFCTYQTSFGYSHFRDEIPNGYSVPNPCSSSTEWLGVGHWNQGGGGARNPFGMDFYKAGKRWTEALCRMDSDNDGVSNGAELGDPDCRWVKGGQASRAATSHPGVCEPLDSAICKATNHQTVCGGEFVCPAMNEPGISILNVTFPGTTPVPEDRTTYQCMLFDFPKDKDYHIVAFTPHIDNINVVHHIVIYGCDDDEGELKKANEPYNCFMGGTRGCETFLGVWALGQDGYCLHPKAGIRVGKSGFKKAVLEIHWNNPQQISTYTDGSGIVFYQTPNLRQHDAGIFMIGSEYLEIPPGEEMHTERGICSGSCTSELINGTVNVVSVFNHMHNLGKKAVSSIINPNNRVEYLGYEETYDYNTPIVHEFAEPKKIHAGDKLEVTCLFNSMSNSKTTRFGLGTDDEMCYAFLVYYPRENLKSDRCVSALGVDSCEVDKPVIQGCNLEEFFSPVNPDGANRYVELQGHCAIGYCKKECIAVVKRMRQLPCYSGVMWKYILRYLEGDSQELCPVHRMYAWLSSCDKEIYMEEMESQQDTTGAAPNIAISVQAVVGIVTALILTF